MNIPLSETELSELVRRSGPQFTVPVVWHTGGCSLDTSEHASLWAVVELGEIRIEKFLADAQAKQVDTETRTRELLAVHGVHDLGDDSTPIAGAEHVLTLRAEALAHAERDLVETLNAITAENMRVTTYALNTQAETPHRTAHGQLAVDVNFHAAAVTVARRDFQRAADSYQQWRLTIIAEGQERWGVFTDQHGCVATFLVNEQAAEQSLRTLRREAPDVAAVPAVVARVCLLHHRQKADACARCAAEPTKE